MILQSGGRAGLAAGGMGRRAFLKLMAAGGAGIAGLKIRINKYIQTKITSGARSCRDGC